MSVLAFSVENTFDGADVGAGDPALDVVVALGGAAAAGFGDPWDGATAGNGVGGGGVGLEPPILSLIVGGGGGASVC